MRIGILTFQFADNYGALLQAYALRQYLLDQGMDQVEIINYASDKLSGAYDINPFKERRISRIVKALVKYPLRRSQAELFKRFREERLGISSPLDIYRMLDTSYDCYVVGSDQVWNSNITFDDYNYYLPSVVSDTTKRIAYAASADDAFLTDTDNAHKADLLRRFDAISVREQQMVTALQEIAGINSTLVLDPVFLLDCNEWRNIARRPRRFSKEHYILYYSLRENTVLDYIAGSLNETRHLPIVVVHPTLRKITAIGMPILGIGPQEFIWLLMNADIIVSNSFHAFSFSYIMGKKIYYDYVMEGSNRITNLVSLFRLSTETDGEMNYIDMSQRDEEIFREYVNRSKVFIETNIINSAG